MNTIIEQFSQLGKYEQFELIEQLWRSLDADENAPPMNDELHDLLESRMQEALQNPGTGQTIEQIAARHGVKL